MASERRGEPAALRLRGFELEAGRISLGDVAAKVSSLGARVAPSGGRSAALGGTVVKPGRGVAFELGLELAVG